VQSSASVGSDPVAVIVSGDGRTAYVADSAPGDVYAVSLPTLKVLWKSHTGGAPFGLLMHLGRLYVSLYDLGQIVELEPSAGRILSYDKAPGHPAALTADSNGDVAVAAGSAFGIALVGTMVWTADYRRSLLMTADGSRQLPLPAPVHPFWLAPGPSGTLLVAAEGESEDSDPGAVFSYDVVGGRFATLARPRDPDQVAAMGSTVYVAAHGDRDILAIEGSSTHHWATGAAAVGLAVDPSENLLVLAVNSHE
jgi:DNA-binding beta-propeller fold protein YncE